MDNITTLASPNSYNFVLGSKQFVHSGMGIMDSIMVFKDHFGFKLCMEIISKVNKKTKYSSSKMSIDLA